VNTRMRVYGLTGGAGSGKSEAGRRLSHAGIPVIDADRVGHELLEPGGAAVDPVIEAFGCEVTTAGAVDRAKLADWVFGDPEALRKLNAIVHPRIMQVTAGRLAALAGAGHAAAVVDAALIAEGGKRDVCLDGLIVVTCREDIRLDRLVRLRGMDIEQARKRIAAQTPAEKKVPLADWVIVNEGSLETLWVRVDEIAAAIRGKDRKP